MTNTIWTNTLSREMTDWMVQVWEEGGWMDYWSVSIYGHSRSAAVKRGPRVFQGQFRDMWKTKSLRWRIGPKLRTYNSPILPDLGKHAACNTCGGVGHSSDYHLLIADRVAIAKAEGNPA